MTSPDELCLSCNHKIDDHKPEKCEGVYNVYDVHGDETVGCLCREFDDDKDRYSQGEIDALADIARALYLRHAGALK